MKTYTLIFVAILFNTVSLFAQNSKKPEDYKIQINQKWFESGSKIEVAEIAKIESIAYQSKTGTEAIVRIDKCMINVSYAKPLSNGTRYTKIGYDSSIKGFASFNMPKDMIGEIKPGDALVFDNLICTSKGSFPTSFKLYFK